MKTQKQQAEAIGISLTSFKRLDVEQRQKWAAVTSEVGCTYDLAFFTELNRLTFEVMAFNALHWQSGKRSIAASLMLGYTINIAVYDVTEGASIALVEPMQLRTFFDVREAIRILKELK